MTSALVRTARSLAERAHHGQKRKALGQPYFSHLEAVVELLIVHGHDDEVTLAAAYLHDVVEDRPEFAEEMTRVMPPAVVGIVHVLSEPKRDASGALLHKSARFDAYVQGLSGDTEAVRRALPISCADKIHNTSSIVLAEAEGESLLLSLKTRPGEHREHLCRLRKLYAPAVAPSLLSAFDEAALRLGALVESWFPGRAALIAAEAHLGRFDDAGAPYIFGPMRLALQTADETERMAVLLHGVVDSSFTLEALRREGCPEPVLRAVDALTRGPGESDDAFIERVAENRVATRVKLLELAHDPELGRIAGPSADDGARARAYRRATDRLRAELETRSLYVKLTPDSVVRARASARLEVPRAEHVTLARRLSPDRAANLVPGGGAIGELVDVRVVAEAVNEAVQVFVVELGGSRVRASDGGVLHLTVSRSGSARSRDANVLLATEAATPVEPFVLRGVVEWADD